MARELDPSWLWGWLWDSIFTVDEPFDNKHCIIAFTTIYVLYKTLEAMGIVLVPNTILLGNCLVSLAVLILSVLRLFILVLIPKIFRDVFESPLRPFFSTMWNVWEYLAMPSILTHLAMIRFRACQAIEMVRVYLISTQDELYEITGTEFQYPDLLDGDITCIQPSDPGAERWMRQLVEEDNIRRQAQVLDEQNRIAEAENKRMGIENERTGLVWEGLQSRGPANSQRLREMARLRLLAPPRPGEETLAGSLRASDPISLPPVHEPAPGPSTAPAPSAPPPPPAPAPADTRPILRGQDIKRAWKEGWYNTLGTRRTVVKNASTQTEPTDLARHDMKNKPLELAPQTYISRGVQTDLVDSPIQEEPEASVVVPELPVPEPSPDPASSEDTDTQTSLDKGKALEGPEPRINANLAIIHGNRVKDEVKELEYSAVSSPLPATITLSESPEPTTNAEPEPVQTHATGLDRPNAIHSSIRAFLRSTQLPTVHSRSSAAGTSRRNGTPESTSVSNVLTSDPIGITSRAQDDQSEASLQAFPEPFSSVVSAEDEPFTGYQSTTVYPSTERSRQALTEALIKACENASKKTPLLKVNEDGTTLPPAPTPLLSNTLSHSIFEGTSIGQLPSSLGSSSVPILEEIEDVEISSDETIAASALHGYNESDEDIYDDSLDGYNVVENQRESLDGGPETPAARTNPQDSDEEMESSEHGAAGDPGVSILEEQTNLASTRDDAQMTDVWRPNEEESKRIGDDAQDLFEDLMDQDDEDSSEDTKPERELSTSPMRDIANEDQQANLEDTAMQDMQSFAPLDFTADFGFSFQQPEAPSVNIGMTDQEEEQLAEELIGALENGSSNTPTQDAQSPTDNDPPDPVLKATAEQLATRKIAKPKSRAHKNTSVVQSTLESVSQEQPHTQPETLQQTPSQVNEDSRNDTTEMDLAARGLLALAAAEGIVVGNDASNQAVSPSGEDSSHKDTDAKQTDAYITNSQKANTHETNVQESSIGDHEVERPTATTLSEEQSEPNSQQPQSASASILPAESQPSLVQPTPT
ncbi:hypothetical protein FACUT_7175 [Fusarium acutatum]|uniref:Nuclear pore complex NUP2/50/61 domain-containing protein n=1 Tax=Fusarium acutatum TaxID=78861 RepID=A0A8H4NF79_9HYPO|nr:hypothetical protein FACUT_7175 [Fusarium acutatum]